MKRISRKRTLLLALVLLMGQALLLPACGPVGAQQKKGNASMSNYQKPKDEDLQKKLSPLQYRVTQHEGTEPPFQNEYWDNKRDGIYVDVVTGEPLFSSLDKFDSGTGWPSFTQPIDKDLVATREDSKFAMRRTEVRSKSGDSHLGHVFDDGPGPTGKRFCINSASLRFIPADKLEEEGYGRYASLFAASSAIKKAVKKETATLAGGCFWGVEDILRTFDGVLETTVGYTGGHLPNPHYEDITTGQTGHAESVQIIFDPTKISYEELLSFFFRLHDPTTLNRQGNDRGTQYRSAIFYHSEEQRQTAQKVIDAVNKSGKWKNPVVTEVVPAQEFYPAEDYHQDYLQKNPGGYTCHYLRD